MVKGQLFQRRRSQMARKEGKVLGFITHQGNASEMFAGTLLYARQNGQKGNQTPTVDDVEQLQCCCSARGRRIGSVTWENSLAGSSKADGVHSL